MWFRGAGCGQRSCGDMGVPRRSLGMRGRARGDDLSADGSCFRPEMGPGGGFRGRVEAVWRASAYGRGFIYQKPTAWMSKPSPFLPDPTPCLPAPTARHADRRARRGCRTARRARRTPMGLVPKLRLGMPLSRQLCCPATACRAIFPERNRRRETGGTWFRGAGAGNGVAGTSACPNGVWARGKREAGDTRGNAPFALGRRRA